MTNFTIVSNDILGPNQLSRDARLLYCQLLRHCGKDNTCYPSQIFLGISMGCSSRMVRIYLDELITFGLIRSKRRGFNRPNTYEVCKNPILERNYISPMDGQAYSSYLRNPLPFHKGTAFPDNITYRKTKAKISEKGLNVLRKMAERIRPTSSKKNDQKDDEAYKKK